MKNTAFAAAVALLIGSSTWAQAPQPSFSGTWTLDLAKSDFGPAPPPESIVSVIEHNDPALKITTTQKTQMGEFVNERLLSTDGKENTNKVRTALGDQDVKSTMRWDGQKLVNAYKMDVQGMSIDVNETWELSPDGKVLTILRNIKTDQGDFAQTNVFNKQ